MNQTKQRTSRSPTVSPSPPLVAVAACPAALLAAALMSVTLMSAATVSAQTAPPPKSTGDADDLYDGLTTPTAPPVAPQTVPKHRGYVGYTPKTHAGSTWHMPGSGAAVNARAGQPQPYGQPAYGQPP